MGGGGGGGEGLITVLDSKNAFFIITCGLLETTEIVPRHLTRTLGQSTLFIALFHVCYLFQPTTTPVVPPPRAEPPREPAVLEPQQHPPPPYVVSIMLTCVTCLLQGACIQICSQVSKLVSMIHWQTLRLEKQIYLN